MLTRREILIVTAGAAAAGSVLWSRSGDTSARVPGARGDGETDDTDAVHQALHLAFENGIPFDGGGHVYAVSGDLRIAAAVRPWIRSLRLRQLAPEGTRKSLHFDNCEGIRVDHLEVDRGTAKDLGALNDSAGLWINGGSEHDLRNVAVFGHGTGNGIAIWNTANSSYSGLQVRDMVYDAPDAVDDILQGIWLNANSDCMLAGAIVSNLKGNADGEFPNRFTRGIALSGNLRVSVTDPDVRDVDQGVDVTGSDGNRQCTVSGGRTLRCTTVGVKLANSAVECKVVGHTAEMAGMFGFAASGPAEPRLPYKTHGCDFIRCTAIDPGSNRFPFPDRPPKGACGFAIWTGDYDPEHPRAIRFIDCHAKDRQPENTMKYGFYSGVPLDRSAPQPNQLVHCTSEGHIVAARGGMWA